MTKFSRLDCRLLATILYSLLFGLFYAFLCYFLFSVVASVFCPLCSVLCVFSSEFSPMCSILCVLSYVFSPICSLLCVLSSVFSPLSSLLCVFSSEFSPLFYSFYCNLLSVVSPLWYLVIGFFTLLPLLQFLSVSTITNICASATILGWLFCAMVSLQDVSVSHFVSLTAINVNRNHERVFRLMNVHTQIHTQRLRLL